MQVTIGRGIQTFYDNNPPEAIDASTKSIDHPPSQGFFTPNKLRKRIGISILAVVLTAAVLGIGLGVGLRKRGERRYGRRRYNPPFLRPRLFLSAQYVFSYLKPLLNFASCTIAASQATATESPIWKHGIMNGTSLAAFSDDDGSRSLFFQDVTGAIRRANYSLEAGSWQAPANWQLQLNVVARNNTPLEIVDFPGFKVGTSSLFP